MPLPIVEKPSFTIGSLHSEASEQRVFDPVNTSCYLRPWQVDEHCAYFMGWTFERQLDGKEGDTSRRILAEGWKSPKGRITFYMGRDDVAPPKYRTSKWRELLEWMMSEGWEPVFRVSLGDNDGKTYYALLTKHTTSAAACEKKGEAVCRGFLAAAWTLQEQSANQGKGENSA